MSRQGRSNRHRTSLLPAPSLEQRSIRISPGIPHSATMSSLRKLIPFGNRVLVKRFEAVAKTASGIYLPDAETKQQNEGEVVAVGPGARAPDGSLIPAQSSVGDKVLLPEYGGSSVKLGDKEFFLFRDEDILGKIE